jgi:chromosome segregation ATPase
MVAALEEEIKNFKNDENWEEPIQKGKDKVKEAEEEIAMVDNEDDNDADDNDEIKKLKEKKEDCKSRAKQAKDDKGKEVHELAKNKKQIEGRSQSSRVVMTTNLPKLKPTWMKLRRS